MGNDHRVHLTPSRNRERGQLGHWGVPVREILRPQPLHLFDARHIAPPQTSGQDQSDGAKLPSSTTSH